MKNLAIAVASITPCLLALGVLAWLALTPECTPESAYEQHGMAAFLDTADPCKYAP